MTEPPLGTNKVWAVMLYSNSGDVIGGVRTAPRLFRTREQAMAEAIAWLPDQTFAWQPERRGPNPVVPLILPVGVCNASRKPHWRGVSALVALFSGSGRGAEAHDLGQSPACGCDPCANRRGDSQYF
jgi:hypothetical protein